MSKNRSKSRRVRTRNQKARRRLQRRRERLEKRLARDNRPDHNRPVLTGSNLHYEVADRQVATKVGGLGIIHLMVRALRLDRVVNGAVSLFKIHNPYFESDHILNIAYNFLAGGRCLEDLEVLRQDEAYLDMLGAERIPDPTTAGDFLRRFDTAEQIGALMDEINEVRLKVWRTRRAMLGRRAVVDVDGTLTPTLGEKKEGMGMSYKRTWSYHPLLVSLANTKEPLFLKNRPGYAPSNAGAAYWIDKAIALCKKVFKEVWIRGDTDFSLTTELDRWDADGVRFFFGYDAKPNLVEEATRLPKRAWSRLKREERTVPEAERRQTRENTKARIVREKEYKNIRLRSEEVAEFNYRPVACKKDYRMVVVKKNLSVERGEKVLFDDVRYFFYITNHRELSKEEVVFEINYRCDQENLIEQLKNGIPALRNPAHDLLSNWAYMVIGSLAWSLKAWAALAVPKKKDRERLLAMEFKTFLNALMLIPAQVVRTGRRIVVRLLAYTHEAKHLFSMLNAFHTLRFG